MNDDLKQVINLEIKCSNDLELYNKIQSIESEIDKLNSKIADYKHKLHLIHYLASICSGIISGFIDIIFVGEFSLTEAHLWGKEKVEKFVIKIAEQKGCKKNNLYDSVIFLEEEYPIAADKATNFFGGGLQHHLRDFSHHASILGLVFSLLTQFTCKVYGTDTNGSFKVYTLEEKDYNLIGKNFKEKIILGVIQWFFHLVSDMAGSKKSVFKGNEGTGIPGPLLSLLKSISSLPFFNNFNEESINNFSIFISKLFNGTAIKDPITGKSNKIRFDLRTEIGLINISDKQAIPIIINECVTRCFYFIYKFYEEVKNCENLNDVNWEKVLPYKDYLLNRMLAISSLTFSFVDNLDSLANASLISAGNKILFCQKFIARKNFVGTGRVIMSIYSVSIGKDSGRNIRNHRIKLLEEENKKISKLIDFENQLEERLQNYLKEDFDFYIKSLNKIKTGLDTNDSNIVIQECNIISNKFGKELPFENQDEFDKLMTSNKDIKF